MKMIVGFIQCKSEYEYFMSPNSDVHNVEDIFNVVQRNIAKQTGGFTKGLLGQKHKVFEF